MVAVNDITRAKLQTKPVTAAYASGWDVIFGSKDKQEETIVSDKETTKERLLNGEG